MRVIWINEQAVRDDDTVFEDIGAMVARFQRSILAGDVMIKVYIRALKLIFA